MLPMNPLEIIIPALTAVGVPAWAGLHPRSQLFGATVCSLGDGCALTFDDGPNPRVTPNLLALLEKYRVPATFFVLGKYVEQYPHLTAEITAAGHTIGNHTFGHPSLLFYSQQQIIDELSRCETTVYTATGRRMNIVRPPFGFRGPQFRSAARKVGLSRTAMWSVSGHDWNQQPAASVSRRIEKVKQGDIILLHDGDHRVANINRSHMLEALANCLPRWQDVGLKFVTL
jgi:peptidoglycan/xylan/chitin deacetylase (PgdA/CDA1 family)